MPGSVSAAVSARRVALILLALLALRLAVAGPIGLAEDEAYYRLWGLHLSFGYFDHPPMVALWIAAGQALFGDTNFGLRFVAVLTPIAGSVLLWATARDLFPDTDTGESESSRRIAARAVLWLNATLLIGIGGLIVSPDQPSVLFWGLTIWALGRLVRTGQGVWWLAIGAAVGLGADSKYTGLFLGPGILLWAIVTPSARRWFLTPWPWLGGISGVLMLAPVLIWNGLHGWPTLHKQFGRVVQAHPITGRYMAELIGGQFGLLNPLIAVFVGLAVWFWLRRKVGNRPVGAGYGLLIWTTLPFVGYLVVFALRDRVQANWPAPIYPPLVLLAAAAAEQASLGTVMRGLRQAATPLGIGLGVIVLLHAAFPVTDFFGEKDPIARLRGWDTVAPAIVDRMHQAGAEWVGVHGDTAAGALAAVMPRAIPVEAIDERYRYIYKPLPDAALLGKPLIVVLRDSHDAPGRIAGCFKEAKPMDPVPLLDGRGHTIGMLHVYQASGPKPDLFTAGCD